MRKFLFKSEPRSSEPARVGFLAQPTLTESGRLSVLPNGQSQTTYFAGHVVADKSSRLSGNKMIQQFANMLLTV